MQWNNSRYFLKVLSSRMVTRNVPESRKYFYNIKFVNQNISIAKQMT